MMKAPRRPTQAELIRSVDEAFNRWFHVRYGKQCRHPWPAQWGKAVRTYAPGQYGQRPKA